MSVVIPVLNEGRDLANCVHNVLSQTHTGDLEVILAMGPSTDGSDAIAAQLAASDPRVRTVPNPSGRTPNALNVGIAAARHDVIVRVDGHSEIPHDYIEVAVRTLEETGADNVGGMMKAVGRTAMERAIAAAMRSRLGVGGGSFHVGGKAGSVPTVYLGVFRRGALERVGGFDERYTRTQDWQLNHRLRQTGGTVWFIPELEVTYRPRSSITALAQQYFNYGRWRRVVMRQHPETVNARYLAAPVMVVSSCAATAGAVMWAPLLVVPAAYLVGITIGGVAISAGEPVAARVLTPAVLATMHWSWGVGFLISPRSLGPQTS